MECPRKAQALGLIWVETSRDSSHSAPAVSLVEVGVRGKGRPREDGWQGTLCKGGGWKSQPPTLDVVAGITDWGQPGEILLARSWRSGENPSTSFF